MIINIISEDQIDNLIEVNFIEDKPEIIEASSEPKRKKIKHYEDDSLTYPNYKNKEKKKPDNNAKINLIDVGVMQRTKNQDKKIGDNCENQNLQ